MEIKYFSEPTPHYIIDEFLTPRAADKILEECIDLEPFYEQAIIVGDHRDASHPDECQECKENKDKFRNMTRDNQTVVLDSLYENKRNQSVTLKYLHDKLLDVEFTKAMESSESMFPMLNMINSSETMLSRYGKCDFYGWHTDSLTPNTESRIITISYYVNKEPLKFDGGNLMLLYSDGKKKKTIIPKHNRAVIFISNTATHSVDYVNLTGKKWDEGRFSIQFWLGYNNNFKFR